MYSQNKTQLFLLHFAGGSCYSFDFLNDALSKKFECHALELPGRGKRNQEELLLHKEEAILDYCNQIRALRNDQPYVVYGHSMGATLGLSVVKKLECYFDPPKIVIVSGNAGPGASYRDIQRYDLNDLEFKEELRTLGGVPEEVLQNQELFDFFSPIMRADFRILEKHKNSEKGLVINTPIYAIMGDEEETVNEIDNWKNFTNGSFNSKVLKGNHFFIHTQKQEVSAILNGFAQNSFQKQV